MICNNGFLQKCLDMVPVACDQSNVHISTSSLVSCLQDQMTSMLNVAVTVTTVTFPYLAGTVIGVTILSWSVG